MSKSYVLFFLPWLLLCAEADGQVVAPHPPLRVLIVSDGVNPHGLPPQDLTEPGDLSTALMSVTGLRTHGLDAVLEIGTDDLQDATALLALPFDDPAAYDVLIYFAHRIPSGADGGTRQDAFVDAVETFLTAGGGVISFHHGLYRTAGKEAMQSLLGAEATGAVPWNTIDGQNVISVSPGHFISRYGVDYDLSLPHEDAAFGVPAGTYPAFNNNPDERYPNTVLLPSAGDLVPLFASDYDAGTHVLGYVQKRPEHSGVVVVYQPGEYQPHALGPGDNNFQILINAILYAGSYAQGEILFADGFESGAVDQWTSQSGG